MRILEGRKAEKKLAKVAKKLTIGDSLSFRALNFPGDQGVSFLFYLKREEALKLNMRQIMEVIENLDEAEIVYGKYEIPECKTVMLLKMRAKKK